MPRFERAEVWEGSSEHYECSVVGQVVPVSTGLRRIYGQRELPLVLLRRMDGCSGNEICHKYAIDKLFHTPANFGGPYHDSL